MILIIPDHIQKDLCSDLISIFNKNKKYTSKWRCTHPLQLQEVEDEDDLIFCKRVCKFICNSSIPTFGIDTYIECAQIVEWPENCFQEPHFDEQRDTTSMVSITYLNDNFMGGSTNLDDLKLSINPATGKTLFFDGMKNRHSVSKVFGGIRYTLALWYTMDINKSIENF